MIKKVLRFLFVSMDCNKIRLELLVLLCILAAVAIYLLLIVYQILATLPPPYQFIYPNNRFLFGPFLYENPMKVTLMLEYAGCYLL